MQSDKIDNIVNTQLKPIHDKLNQFQPKYELLREIPEQIMACTNINSDDCVLELGGSIGRNSCVINSILKNKSHHLVIEPSINEARKLKNNRDNNNLGFLIEESAISDVPLYSKGWYTFTTQINGSVKVNTISYNDIISKYNLNFNVLVIDNEGNFVSMLKSFPNILDGIRLLIIEHDFNSMDDLNYFYKIMKSNNYEISSTYLKNDKYGPGNNWSDGVVGDNIFVSVWSKIL